MESDHGMTLRLRDLKSTPLRAGVYGIQCLVLPSKGSYKLTRVSDGLVHSMSWIHCGPKDYSAVEWMMVKRSRTTLIGAPLITRSN
ncbi:unnamed protein product [Lasius platythorax]|uniref:Uncharacterized protein n=1 Tax=Lasius platythorax TaxID=488582 RepID=A0AAV2PAB8_9HYME